MKLKINLENKFIIKIRKFILKYIFGKKYIRFGECKCCGACCSHIYITHKGAVINDEEKFKKLQKFNWFYSTLEVIDADEIGLIFKCTNLDEEKKMCKIHKQRDKICRKYPQEEIFMLGGSLGENCGYRFEPIDKFDDILKKIQKKSKN